MDEKIEKAFEVVNYMATLSNQRKILAEEFNQNLSFYINGATFKISPELISFTKVILDSGNIKNIPFIDSNNLPVMIEDVAEFYDKILEQYLKELTDYADKYATIKSKRKIADMIGL